MPTSFPLSGNAPSSGRSFRTPKSEFSASFLFFPLQRSSYYASFFFFLPSEIAFLSHVLPFSRTFFFPCNRSLVGDQSFQCIGLQATACFPSAPRPFSPTVSPPLTLRRSQHSSGPYEVIRSFFFTFFFRSTNVFFPIDHLSSPFIPVLPFPVARDRFCSFAPA